MLSYIGGKSKIGKWIVPYYLEDMETYVETFGGMFWCFFNMDLRKFPNLKRVVYNDFNPLNYNLFQCVQNPSELQRVLDSIQVQQLGVSNTDEIFRTRFQDFQRELFSSVIDLKGKYRSKYLSFRDKLSNPKWVEHFSRITHVENMDFQQVIEKYDSPSTYIYLDPPYWKTENYYSNHDFDRADHERLATTLNSVQSKFSLSYYDFELLHQWFPEDRFRWEKKQFAKAAAAKKGVKQNMGEELLILNY